MGTIHVRELTGGLDARRLPETAAGGTLIRAFDGHINRGGAFEKRPAFVKRWTLPPGTLGLASNTQGLFVFGRDANPGVPLGLGYQQLPYPDPNVDLEAVLSTTVFGGNRLYVAALMSDGSRAHYYDGVRVEEWADGRSRALLRVVAGSTGGTVNAINVGGVNILGDLPVAWAGDTARTAARIVQEINGVTTAGTDYEAYRIDETVVAITAVHAGAAPNGLPVTFDAQGIDLIPAANLAMSGGVDQSASSLTPGPFVFTSGAKVFSTSGSVLFFSGIEQPTKWTGAVTGAGFIDMSTQSGGSQKLTALARYNNYMAVFAEHTVQIWYFEPDPTLSRQVQVMDNTGTYSPRSVTQYGDTDVYYLDESGVRSLKARDASNAAFTSDIGNAVDDLLRKDLDGMTVEERANVIGLIEPTYGRFWLIVRDKIYVFSYFSSSKISAWTIYRPGFVVEEAVVHNRKVYLRSGNDIYVFGGPGAETVYDDTVAEAWFPFLDANAPTRTKLFTGFDFVGRGDWRVRVGFRPLSPEADQHLARVDGTTLAEQQHQGVGESTHISLRFLTEGSGPAELHQAVIHYAPDAREDAAQG